jgi:hypothetical protein
MHGIKVESLHMDTTNCSVQGEYENYPADDFAVTFCGAPKSHRKDFKL